MSYMPKDDNNESIQVLAINNAQSPLSFSNVSAQSAAFGANTNVIRVVATQACHIAFGSSPTATTDDTFLPANTIEYFKVTPSEKLAALQSSSTGILYISEML